MSMQRHSIPRVCVAPLARHRRFLSLRAGARRAAAPLARIERVVLRPRHAAPQALSFAIHVAASLRLASHSHAVLIRAAAPLVHVPTVERHEASLLRERSSEHRTFHLRTRQEAAPRERIVPVPQVRVVVAHTLPHILRRTETQGVYPPVIKALAQPAIEHELGSKRREPAEVPVVQASGREPPRAAGTPAGAAWSLPAQELARLTATVSHRVISELEHRALSFRERNGRL
ncbi:hypothetical protein [Caballeronia cordobensis]|uniref:hypothetical protein n=1 Tax=Caballeronia cordobensis TaxID=1353886 RepID=UPI00045F0205|nr:hypothetical protein BRPE67_CCDS06680 [Burkholderia sp. RPE67]